MDYPERLTNGLVLVKWWLLAIPHYLVPAALAGGALILSASCLGFDPFGWGRASSAAGLSLLGALVLIAAVILLFTGHRAEGPSQLIGRVPARFSPLLPGDEKAGSARAEELETAGRDQASSASAPSSPTAVRTLGARPQTSRGLSPLSRGFGSFHPEV